MEADDAYWRQPGADGAAPADPSHPANPTANRSTTAPTHPNAAPAHPAALEDAGYWSTATSAASDNPWSAPAPAGQPGGDPYPGSGYQGPPRSTLPPADWRPASVVEPAPPRRLPPQDHGALDDEEARARTFTRGIALVTAALLVLVLCALCGRALW